MLCTKCSMNSQIKYVPPTQSSDCLITWKGLLACYLRKAVLFRKRKYRFQALQVLDLFVHVDTTISHLQCAAMS